MTDYLNTDYCNFTNDASASSFGWNFQSNAGIFLFLKYIKESESIKIESALQDIEITLQNGSKILAQAKSAQDYTIANDKKEKFKDALISLAKFSDSGDRLIYISNIPDTFSSAKDAFNNKVVSYSACLKGTQDEINAIFDAVCSSIKAKVSKEKKPKRIAQLSKVLALVEGFDRTKLSIAVISPFWGDDDNRYSEIAGTILDFLVNDLKLGRDDAIAIKQKLLEHWQIKFQHNSSQPDRDAQKRITKKEFAWPVAVYLTEGVVPEIEDCLSFVPDQSLMHEITSIMSSPTMVYHERFEFSNKVIQDYIEFRNSQPVGTQDIEKLFIKNHGNDYCTEFKTDDDVEKTEYLTKSFIFKILVNHRNMSKISAGIGVKL